MGRSLLVAIGLALTLSSLIPVDSTDQISTAPRYLTKIGLLLNFTRCEPFDSVNDYGLSVGVVSGLLTIFLKTGHWCHQQIQSVFSLLGNSLVFIYCCLSIGSLCDQHFVPSLSSLGKCKSTFNA